MNLIIDVGNTTTKFAVFKQAKLIFKTTFSTNQLRDEYAIIRRAYPELDYAIIASVGKISKSELSVIESDINCHVLSYRSKLPFANNYASLETLGVDRMALVSAAVLTYPEKNVLIIDAGTCITYDFINKDGTYLGGAISPGLRLRYRSLNNFTANLPLLDTNQPKDIIGNTTEASIHSGVVIGAVKEIDGVIDEYLKKYQDLTVILTGGDAEFLSNQLKNSIFARLNFLLEGLNFILDYNS